MPPSMAAPPASGTGIAVLRGCADEPGRARPPSVRGAEGAPLFVAAHLGTRIWGGAERATSLLLAGLQERGHRVRLFCNAEVVAEGAAALGVPARILPIGGDVALPHAFRLAAALRRDRPDVFVAATWKKLAWASLGARLAGVPRVVARVGLEGDGPRSLKYRVALARWVDVVVVVAARLRAPFTALPGWGEGRVPVIPNGVRAQGPPRTAAEARARLGIPADAPVVGSVGRLADTKRFDRLLEAAALLSDGVRVVLAGDGPLRASLAARARGLGIEERVHFLGWRDDPADVLAALDVYAVTSDREGMSSAMLEALAAGLPVVSTPVSGAGDALGAADGAAAPGVVTAGFGAGEVARALAALLADPARRTAMGAAGRRAAGERFGFEGVLDRWEAALGVPGREAPAP